MPKGITNQPHDHRKIRLLSQEVAIFRKIASAGSRSRHQTTAYGTLLEGEYSVVAHQQASKTPQAQAKDVPDQH